MHARGIDSRIRFYTMYKFLAIEVSLVYAKKRWKYVAAAEVWCDSHIYSYLYARQHYS